MTPLTLLDPGLQATYKDTTGKSRVEIKHRDLFSPEQLLEQEKKHPAYEHRYSPYAYAGFR